MDILYNIGSFISFLGIIFLLIGFADGFLASI